MTYELTEMREESKLVLDGVSFFELDDLEKVMLEGPKAECVTEHIFGPGIYIRQITMPAGALVLGHSHKVPGLNMVLKGKLELVANGIRREIEAPYIFTTEEGRKLLFIIEECVFQNIFATEETDLDKLEEMLVDKSEAYKEASK